MKGIVIFIAGVAVGVVVMLMWQRPPEEPATSATRRTTAPRPIAAEPVREARTDGPADAGEASADLAPIAEPSAPDLDTALSEAGGDYEAMIVDQDTLLGGLVEELVTGDRFHDFALALAATPSAVAMERYQILDERLRQLPALQSGAVYARDLACGRLVCTATLVGSDEQSVETAWAEYAGDSRALVPGEGSSIALAESGLTVAHSLRTMNGFERRIVVAMDPGIRSYTGQRVRVFRPRDPH